MMKVLPFLSFGHIIKLVDGFKEAPFVLGLLPSVLIFLASLNMGGSHTFLCAQVIFNQLMDGQVHHWSPELVSKFAKGAFGSHQEVFLLN